MGRITKNYILNTAYQLLTLLAPIITAPYLARVLGADQLGIYSYVSSSSNIIVTLCLLGIYAYGNRQTAYVRDNKEELTKTFWELELTRILLGILGTIVYIIYLQLNSQKGYSIYFLIYYPYILAQIIDCSWVYVGLEDMGPAILKNFAAKLINVICIFVLIKQKSDLWIYILMLSMTTLLANITIYFQLHKYIGRPKANLANIPTHIKGSIHLFLPQVASLFYLQVDKVMLEWMTGTTSQVSYYDHAEKIITIPLSLITVISTVMMPRIANEFKKNNLETIRTLLIRAGRYASFMAAPMMMGLLCVSRQFIPWYLGEDFLPTAYTMMVLVPIVMFNSLSGISGAQYFTASNQVDILLKAYISAAVLNIVMNAFLIPRLGCIGAAISTVASSGISVTIQYFYLSKQMDIRKLVGSTVRYIAYAMIMALVVYTITYSQAATPWTTLLQVMIGIVVYLGIMLMTRDDTFFEILGMLKGRIKRIKNGN